MKWMPQVIEVCGKSSVLVEFLEEDDAAGLYACHEPHL